MGTEKTKSANTIETETLSVRGNLIIWENTMIQISNIAMISTDNIIREPFPFLSLLPIVLGLWGFTVNPLIGLVLLVVGGAMIFSWSKKEQERRISKMLTFMMSSGDRFSLVFRNQEFLKRVSSALMELLAEGKDNTSITFNINNSSIIKSSLTGKNEK